MRLKKGFTLAEILFVLMVIGVIATMTVPSMMKGVQEAQYKTAVKKAYNTISNMTAKFGVEGKMPVYDSTNMNTETSRFFVAMMENLSITSVSSHPIGDRTVAARNAEVRLKYKVDNNEKEFGTGTVTSLQTSWPTAFAKNTNATQWLTTDDGLSYTLVAGKMCEAKNTVSKETTTAKLLEKSCLAVVVDVNGLNKTPNYIEPQSDIQSTNADMQPLTGDTYAFFVARDGVYTGSKLNQAAARIIADMK